MATYPRRRSARRFSKRSGRLLWQLADTTVYSLPQNGTLTTDITPSSILPDTMRPGLVIERVIGTWGLRADTSNSDGAMAMAMYTQRQEAYAGGILPEVRYDEWAYMIRDIQNVRVASTSVVGTSANQWHTFPVDIKAKRRFRSPDDTLVQKFENVSFGACTIRVVLNVRILMRIP